MVLFNTEEVWGLLYKTHKSFIHNIQMVCSEKVTTTSVSQMKKRHPLHTQHTASK